MSDRPDILLILADQWGAASVGAYGCDVPGVTPHLDALAAQGVRYERHYTPTPICAPARNAMLTGRSPSVTGVVANDIEPRADIPFVTAELREVGYHTVGVGKFHFTPHTNYPPSDLDHLGFDQVEVTEDTRHGAWLDWVSREHPEHYEAAFATAWPTPYLAALPPDGRDARAEWAAAHARHVEPLTAAPYRRIAHPSPLPAEVQQSAWIADRAIANLTEAAASSAPTFHYVSFVDPHDPYDPPQEWASRFDWQDMPAPIPQAWDRSSAPWEYAVFQDSKFDLDTFDGETWARLRAAFYASAAFVDHQIGRVLDAVAASGRDTLVLFTTDHGDLIGDHGLLMKGPWHYDRAIRCPMIVAGAGTARGQVFDGLTSHLDLRPTILDAAGLDPGPGEGYVLPRHAEQLAGARRRERLVVETNTSYVAPARDLVRTVITDDGWRLSVFCDQQWGELFDLTNDPDEQHNLFHDDGHLRRRLALTEALVAESAAAVMARYDQPGVKATAPDAKSATAGATS